MPDFINAVIAALVLVPSVASAQTSSAFVAKFPGASMPSSIVISAASVAVAPGYTALVPLNLSNTGTFAPGSFQLDLTFDPQLLTFVSAAAGAVLSAAGAVLSSSVVATGDLHLSAAAAGGNTIPSGVLLSVSFTATPQFAASSPLTFFGCFQKRAISERSLH